MKPHRFGSVTARQRPPELRAQHEAAPPSTPPISIVIADGAEFYREMLKLALEALPSLAVLGVAGDGRQALKLVAAQHPDLVLLGFDLSGINGLQSMALIHEYYPATRVIIIAAEDSDDVRATCLAQGADGFICTRRLHPELRQGIAEVFSDWTASSLPEMQEAGSCSIPVA